MSFWQFIDELIRHPPSWIIVLLLAVLVIHLLETTANIVARLSSSEKSLFGILELFMVITVGTLTMKAFYWETMEGGSVLHEWYEHPLVMLAIWIITTLASMIGYIKLIKSSKKT